MADGIVLTERGPLRAAAFSWQTSEQRIVLTVICKVTYQLAAGQSFVASEQVDVHREDVPWGRDRRHSLQAASELVPYKRGVDIVLTGHAYAPYGRPTKCMTVQMAIGAFRKSMLVYGDRQLSLRGQISEPAEFTKMPLCWERAVGGPGTSNPVGIAVSSAWMPNFQPSQLTTTMSRIPPTGMGPIAPQWPERMQRLGAYASAWDHGQWVSRPLPKDIDANYFNCAPLDQQVSHIDLTETIELENLLAESPHLTTRLPVGIPTATLRRHSIEQPLNLRCDTIWIDTDSGICCVTWRGSQLVESTYGIEILANMASSRPEPAAFARTNSSHRTDMARSSFVHEASTSEENDAAATTLIGLQLPPTGSALPFASGVSDLFYPPTKAGATSIRRDDDDPTATQMVSFVQHVRDLPFHSSLAAMEIASPMPPMPVARIAEPAIVAAPPPFVSTEPSKLGMTHQQDVPLEHSVELVKPPPIGPLAKVELEEPVVSASNTDAPAVSFDAASITLETWAEMTAEIDKAVQARKDVLDAHGLTEAEFKAVDKHLSVSLEEEAAHLGFALRFKFDAAYVGKLEQLRRKEITTAEYARIAGAGGHARVAEVLREMEMPTEAHLPIVRQWTAKLARNRKLSAELTQLMLSARGGADKPALEMSR